MNIEKDNDPYAFSPMSSGGGGKGINRREWEKLKRTFSLFFCNTNVLCSMYVQFLSFSCFNYLQYVFLDMSKTGKRKKSREKLVVFLDILKKKIRMKKFFFPPPMSDCTQNLIKFFFLLLLPSQLAI